MKKIFNRSRIYILSIFLIIVDQLVKLLVIKNSNNLPKQIITGLLKFTYCENRGVAFSLGEGKVVLFVILNIVLISILIVFYEIKRDKFNKLGSFFVALTIAGGTSNLLDRMFRHFVVDFIDISDFINFAVFNVADIFITVGVFGLAIYYIWKGDSMKK